MENVGKEAYTDAKANPSEFVELIVSDAFVEKDYSTAPLLCAEMIPKTGMVRIDVIGELTFVEAGNEGPLRSKGSEIFLCRFL